MFPAFKSRRSAGIMFHDRILRQIEWRCARASLLENAVRSYTRTIVRDEIEPKRRREFHQKTVTRR